MIFAICTYPDLSLSQREWTLFIVTDLLFSRTDGYIDLRVGSSEQFTYLI